MASPLLRYAVTLVTLVAAWSAAAKPKKVAPPPPPASAPAPAPAPVQPQEASPAPPRGEPAPAPPPAPDLVDTEIVSTEDVRPFDVYAAGQHVCTTPCRLQFYPSTELTLRTRSGRHEKRGEIWIPHLQPFAPGGGLRIEAHPYHEGMFATGVTFTTLGGMGVVVGAVLTPVGCSDTARRGGMCTAGLITLGASAAITSGALWLLMESFSRAVVKPL